MNTEMKQPSIELQEVASSQIHSIGYDATTSTLAIRFKTFRGQPASLYHYDNFTPEDFEAFKSAESLGSHFGKHIKPYDKKYPYRKIDESQAE